MYFDRDSYQKSARRAREERWRVRGRARVVHPKYGAVVVPHRSNYSALLNAAEYWGCEWTDMEGSEQVRTVLDMTADAWKKVYLTEEWPESVSNVLGLNLAPYAQGEQDTEKLKVAAAPNGLWCSACRCKVDGELIFYNEAYLAPLAEEIKKSEYIYYTARQTEAGQRYLVVHDGMDVLAAIMPMNILKEEYINDLAEFQALCMEQFYKDKERREAVIEEAEDDAEDAGQIGMEGVEDGE